jgi:hypothetical protein
MKLSDTENTIINAMARAFYVSAWAERQEEKGRSFAGQELMDVAPKTPKFVRDFALMFAGRLHEANDCAGSLLVLLNEAAKADVLETKGLDKSEVPLWFQHPYLESEVSELTDDKYASDFGHYLAMQAMGHGVSWFDDHAKFDLKVPHVEFYL